MGSVVEAKSNYVGRESRSGRKSNIVHALFALQLIEMLQRLNLYPISMEWISDRTRMLKYQNGYVKLLVERERLNKLINNRLYKYVKQ
jgi:hypothetical protein